MIDTVVNWGIALMVARKKAGMTQQDASKELGVTRPYLSLIETNPNKASRDIIEKAAALYGLKVSELAALGE